MAPKHDEKPSIPSEYKVPDVWREPGAMVGLALASRVGTLSPRRLAQNTLPL
jgi:hypothetical protein